jgi:hypothetical protein
MTKIAGSGSASGSESGSSSQRHGSADPYPDPDPPQNVMDPQHCQKHVDSVDPDSDPDLQHWFLPTSLNLANMKNAAF